MTLIRSEAPIGHREAIFAEVRELYESKYPVKEGGVFSNYDWRRCEEALNLVIGPAVLEVGVGPGQMFNILARDPLIRELAGIDLVWNKKLIVPKFGNLEQGNLLHLRFADTSFDTVICMEVLEHLETIDFPKALYELRRVCLRRLIVTVPYDEPEPLWHHDRKGGHRQRFTEEKIERWFPRAERFAISRGGRKWPWMMLVENGPWLASSANSM